MVKLLVTMINSNAMPTPPSTAVLESVAAMIEQLAGERLNVGNIDVQVDELQRFGKSLQQSLVK